MIQRLPMLPRLGACGHEIQPGGLLVWHCCDRPDCERTSPICGDDETATAWALAHGWTVTDTTTLCAEHSKKET